MKKSGHKSVKFWNVQLQIACYDTLWYVHCLRFTSIGLLTSYKVSLHWIQVDFRQLEFHPGFHGQRQSRVTRPFPLLPEPTNKSGEKRSGGVARAPNHTCL